MTRDAASAARRHGVRCECLFMKPSDEQLAAIVRAAEEAGTVRPIIDQLFGFDQVREAIAHVEAGHAKGEFVARIRGRNRSRCFPHCVGEPMTHCTKV